MLFHLKKLNLAIKLLELQVIIHSASDCWLLLSYILSGKRIVVKRGSFFKIVEKYMSIQVTSSRIRWSGKLTLVLKKGTNHGSMRESVKAQQTVEKSGQCVNTGRWLGIYLVGPYGLKWTEYTPTCSCHYSVLIVMRPEKVSVWCTYLKI